MALQTVTVKLPQAIYRRLKRTAQLTNQSLDAVLLQTIRGNVPPSLEDVPAELRDGCAALIGLNDDDLWAVAQSPIEPKQWRRHKRLLQKNTAGNLTERERSELEHLRAEADRHVLRQSFALALLKWRGYTLASVDSAATHGSD